MMREAKSSNASIAPPVVNMIACSIMVEFRSGIIAASAPTQQRLIGPRNLPDFFRTCNGDAQAQRRVRPMGGICFDS